MGRDTAEHNFDINVCNRYNSANTRCAILKHGTGRMQFLNLWPYLSEHWPKYNDQIHHAGHLSETAVTMILSTLKPYVNLSVSASDAPVPGCPSVRGAGVVRREASKHTRPAKAAGAANIRELAPKAAGTAQPTSVRRYFGEAWAALAQRSTTLLASTRSQILG
jgi:hypothetical protein